MTVRKGVKRPASISQILNESDEYYEYQVHELIYNLINKTGYTTPLAATICDAASLRHESMGIGFESKK